MYETPQRARQRARDARRIIITDMPGPIRRARVRVTSYVRHGWTAEVARFEQELQRQARYLDEPLKVVAFWILAAPRMIFMYAGAVAMWLVKTTGRTLITVPALFILLMYAWLG